MPIGYSKVTWIEHVEADDTAIYNIYKPLLNSGLAFGAKRWIATLDRQCEWLASAMATNLPDDNMTNMSSIRRSRGKKECVEASRENDN